MFWLKFWVKKADEMKRSSYAMDVQSLFVALDKFVYTISATLKYFKRNIFL